MKLDYFVSWSVRGRGSWGPQLSRMKLIDQQGTQTCSFWRNMYSAFNEPLIYETLRLFYHFLSSLFYLLFMMILLLDYFGALQTYLDLCWCFLVSSIRPVGIFANFIIISCQHFVFKVSTQLAYSFVDISVLYHKSVF